MNTRGRLSAQGTGPEFDTGRGEKAYLPWIRFWLAGGKKDGGAGSAETVLFRWRGSNGELKWDRPVVPETTTCDSIVKS
jgi:hypothetical protein